MNKNILVSNVTITSEGTIELDRQDAEHIVHESKNKTFVGIYFGKIVLVTNFHSIQKIIKSSKYDGPPYLALDSNLSTKDVEFIFEHMKHKKVYKTKNL